MSEIRQDPTTGRWVVVAPERGRRPNAAPAEPGPTWKPGPHFDPGCPFCPGNEQMLPGIIDEVPCASAPGWLTRVVPNKYPAVQSAGRAMPELGEALGVLPGHGFHEVIVEHSRHDADLAEMDKPHLATVIATYQKRFDELSARPGIKAVMVFRNRGARAGASLPHPHAQAIATPVVPPRLAEIASWGKAQYQEHETCATCAHIARELEDGLRVVEATETFVALVPVAAESPFEVWIAPRRHHAAFTVSSDQEIGELGGLLVRVLKRIAKAAGDPPYTFAIQSAPLGHADAPYFHWRLRIVPNVVIAGGFEIGGGLGINPSSPERDAETLRCAETH